MLDAFGRTTSQPTIIKRLTIHRRADESLEESINRVFPCQCIIDNGESFDIVTDDYTYTYTHSGASKCYYEGAPQAHVYLIRFDKRERKAHFHVNH